MKPINKIKHHIINLPNCYLKKKKLYYQIGSHLIYLTTQFFFNVNRISSTLNIEFCGTQMTDKLFQIFLTLLHVQVSDQTQDLN
jgi:hypothetical protein